MASLLRSVFAVELFRSHLGGEEQTETGATARSVADLDAAAMRHDDALANCQPQSVAGHRRLLRRLLAEERQEYAFAIFTTDTWPLVFDGQLQFAVVHNAS